MSNPAHANRLAGETSPYLLQHAHNPVDWHAWNADALALARTQNKPILLSIGYSACHWCHVMAHESFEDADTAALMNRLFVNIKVDREERPDLDRVYQLAHQVLVQRGGGWPLTVFLTPDDLTPFFAGTYFPREPRYGMPGFREVLERVAQFYREHRDELRQQNAALRDAIQRSAGETATSAGELTRAPLEAAYRSLTESFDARFGGFGRAPKFPHAPSLEFLLWHAADADSDAHSANHSRTMVETTLTRMAQGGLYDQLGGGFCRYSTDAAWMIPHFEKMLYDNGPLLALYAQTAKFTGSSFYADIAKQTAAWVMAEMQSPQGGYYSSLDADSEGHEGKYYIWDKEEVRALLSPEEFAAFAPRYGLDQPPNFEGHWHLYVPQIATPSPPSVRAEDQAVLESARRKLLEARRKRVRPGLDDKVLTAWNGLMIRGMALAGRLLDEPRFVEFAERAARFVRGHLCRDGQLLASWRDGQARLPAYLDDYALLLDGVLELLQARWDSELFGFARQLADGLLARFEDKEHGGFWFTANDQDIPLYRPKTFSDESLPAGNAVAARVLLRLGHVCAEPRYLDAAERTVKAALPSVNRYPEAHASMLLALQDALEPPTMVVVRGKADKLHAWQKQLDRKFDPRRIVLAIPSDAENLMGLLAQCAPRGDACAYVCRGTQCSLPIETLEELASL
ncbi:MAG: thioredoxin domain-containing protein [Gammaproteobacteria bacterium]|nr:thioredoxin domain-containing protein [Gammaproteobacteria bacterium]